MDEQVTNITESMDDYRNELDASMKTVEEGDILSGTVISVTDTEIIVDLKYYAEGIIRQDQFSNDPNFLVKEKIHVGDSISAQVIRKDDGEGNLLLSLKNANDVIVWTKLMDLKENQTILHGKISEIVKSGVIVYVEGIRGFIPASKLDVEYIDNLNDWLYKDVDFLVVTVDEAQKKLVLSRKEIELERKAQENNTKIQKVAVGSVLNGTVESLKDYGAFILLENGLTGLLHISQISHKRIKSPSSVLKIGDTVSVKIISTSQNKISLSMKAVQDETEEIYEDIPIEYTSSESVSTGLGDLLSKIKL